MYIPTTYRHDLSERIDGFKQGSKTMVENSNEFHTLSRRVDVDEPEYIIVGRYKYGFS